MTRTKTIYFGLQLITICGLAYTTVEHALTVEARPSKDELHMTCSSSVTIFENGKARKLASEIHDCSEVSK